MGMKINWGTAIVLAFIAFIGFIVILVVQMTTNEKYDYDMVTEEYYKKELTFQDQLDKQVLTNDRKMAPNILISENGIDIQFPGNLNEKNIKGTVFLYRPSNKQLDFEVPISLSTSHLLIPKNRLLDGRWNIEINFTYNNESFLTKKEIWF